MGEGGKRGWGTGAAAGGLGGGWGGAGSSGVVSTMAGKTCKGEGVEGKVAAMRRSRVEEILSKVD